MIAQNSEVYNPPTYLFQYTRIWKKISVGGVVYFTVLCDHPCLVSLLFAVLVSLHPVTFSNVFYYLYIYIYIYIYIYAASSVLDAAVKINCLAMLGNKLVMSCIATCVYA